MRESFGLGTIQLIFKELPLIAQYYMKQADAEGSFMSTLGGPVVRVTTPGEALRTLARTPDIFREHLADSSYWEASYFNNNSGGPTYVIPKDFVSDELVQHIQKELA